MKHFEVYRHDFEQILEKLGLIEQATYEFLISSAVGNFSSRLESIEKPESPVQNFYLKCALKYEQGLLLMNEMRAFVQAHPYSRVFILTVHEHCLTHGRGLQKGTSYPNLIADDVDYLKKIANCHQWPFHEVDRGGGLTFHYPGQIVLYPIVHVPDWPGGLKGLFKFLQNLAADFFAEFGLKLDLDHPLLGVWCEGKKYGSLGISIKKWISAHGLALNILHDEAFFQALAETHPCGLSVRTYASLESSLGRELNIKDLQELFFFRLQKKSESL